MAIKSSEHVFISGMTGTGKSELASIYLAGQPKVVKLDTKGEAPFLLAKGKSPWPHVDPKQLLIVSRLEDLIDYAKEAPYLIYSPEHDELNEDYYDEFFMWAYYNRKISVWVDEVMEVLDSPHKLLRWYKGILTRGRFFDVNMWQCTQRPMGLPPMTIAQATHIFAFDMQLDQDRKKITDVTGVSDFMTKPDGHSFWYWKSGWRNARLGVLDMEA